MVKIEKCKYEKYFIGERYLNKDGYEFEIIGYCDTCKKRKIRFDSGYEVEAFTYRIKDGGVKDWLSPSFLGIGIVGFRKATNHFLYKRWACMMHRCYNENDPNYLFYGKKGVCVEEYLRSFPNYIKFIESLDGYEKLIEYPKKYQIDKDIKSKNEKVYSRETIKIVTFNENMHNATKDKKTKVKMIDKETGKVIKIFRSVYEAYIETGIKHQSIFKVLNGDYKQAGGYVWEKADGGEYGYKEN